MNVSPKSLISSRPVSSIIRITHGSRVDNELVMGYVT